MNISLEERAEAGELALKAHTLWSDRELSAEITDEARVREEILQTVDLTEAPEDAVCSLVIDLLSYCEREKIDWDTDVMARAMRRTTNSTVAGRSLPRRSSDKARKG